MEEALQNIRTIKAFATEEFEHDKFSEKNQSVYKTGSKLSVLIGALIGGIQFMFGFCMGAVVYYSSQLYSEGEISIGDITAFLLFMIQLMMNFAITTGAIGNIYKLFGASEKIFKMMRYQPDVNSTGGFVPQREEVTGEFEF